ncbi:hypothetical protein, partial [Janthinobacterium sp. HH104]|uniref:hypothetical protein n=1 Tax=Janthinobacterium sp. HH104 TaxID=1537276 RepID=UPI001C2F2FAA
KALCLSAAKKEEYEAFQHNRQLLLFLYFTQHLHASFSEGANYSPASHSPQALFTAPHRPASLAFTSSAFLCSLSQSAGVVRGL